ncbi:hypothetical protein DERF_009672 [Dermatophagoides farinae]|uniref:Uncharacterized protein n=1 Tax=Dermatophagoides farinae TaxID=6954 RepID=A0A922HZN0_DERFA|nr:hypothetical protein DERF_009672 [Dermatophagoides farinae]
MRIKHNLSICNSIQNIISALNITFGPIHNNQTLDKECINRAKRVNQQQQRSSYPQSRTTGQQKQEMCVMFKVESQQQCGSAKTRKQLAKRCGLGLKCLRLNHTRPIKH